MLHVLDGLRQQLWRRFEQMLPLLVVFVHFERSSWDAKHWKMVEDEKD